MHINFVASALLLLLSLSAPEATVAQQDDACLPLGCTECISNATCNWFVCSESQDMTGCHSAEGAGAGAEGCHPVIDDAECETSSTTVEPPASTTVFPTTTTNPPETTTTTAPDTTTNPPETTTTTAPDTTTNPPDTTTTTAPDTTTNPPDTTTTTAPDTTTNPPDTTTTGAPDTTTTVAPETTTDGPPPPAPTPSPPQPRSSGFSFGSFFGGMVFCLVIVAGVFVGLKIYRRRQAMGGNYNNL